jgi:hypothetical protein
LTLRFNRKLRPLMRSNVKHILAASMLLLVSGYSMAQKPTPPKRDVQRDEQMIVGPGFLTITPGPSNFVEWIRQHGGSAAPNTYAIEYLNYCFYHKSGFIAGIAVGGIHSPVWKSSFSTSYGDMILGAKIFSNNFFQVNALGHVDLLRYTITGLPGPTWARVSNDKQYYRSFTWGGGVSLQLQIRLIKKYDYDLSLGIEPGILVVADQPTWEYGYKAYPQSSSTPQFYGVGADGPEVPQQYKYIRFSLIMRM